MTPAPPRCPVGTVRPGRLPEPLLVQGCVRKWLTGVPGGPVYPGPLPLSSPARWSGHPVGRPPWSDYGPFVSGQSEQQQAPQPGHRGSDGAGRVVESGRLAAASPLWLRTQSWRVVRGASALRVTRSRGSPAGAPRGCRPWAGKRGVSEVSGREDPLLPCPRPAPVQGGAQGKRRNSAGHAPAPAPKLCWNLLGVPSTTGPCRGEREPPDPGLTAPAITPEPRQPLPVSPSPDLSWGRSDGPCAAHLVPLLLLGSGCWDPSWRVMHPPICGCRGRRGVG